MSTNANQVEHHKIGPEWELVSLLTHECRTPLTTVIGYLEMVLDEEAGTLNEPQSRFLNVAKKSAEDLKVLIDEFGEVARIALGHVDLHPETLALDQQVNAAVAVLGSTLPEQRTVVQPRIEGTLPMVRVDPRHLKHILMTLLTRAQRHAGDAGIIEIAVRRSQQRDVAVEIIAKSQRGEGNHPVPGTSARPGEGAMLSEPVKELRLEAAHALVNLLGGETDFSTVGGEMRFWFTLPAIAAGGVQDGAV